MDKLFDRTVKIFFVALILYMVIMMAAGAETISSFETGNEGWTIPRWVEDKADYSTKSVYKNDTWASEGKHSLAIMTELKWTGFNCAYVELEQDKDWTGKQVAFDVYLPKGPSGLKVRLILTSGPDYIWGEGKELAELKAGETVTLTTDLSKIKGDMSQIHKVGIRIESKNIGYTGNIYIDNVRVEK